MKRRLFTVLILLAAASLLALPAGAQDDANRVDGCVTDFDPAVDYFPEKVEIEYAEGLGIEYYNNYKVVTVLTPWPGAEETFQYVLVQCGTPAPEGYENAQVIEVPVKTTVSMSSPELPRLEVLGALDTLIGIDVIMYINNPAVIEKFDAGELVEIGEGPSVNVEMALDAQPDIVIATGMGNPDWDAHPLLVEAGIPVVITADWVETSPLGRAEWIKFTAAFYNREAAANTTFDEVAADYEAMVALTADLPEDARPTVFNNTPFEGTWYVSGGKSYAARLFADAGADYLWADDESTGSLYLDFETVFEIAADADFWLSPGMWTSLDDGLATDDRFTEFASFQSGQVYNNDARVNASGFSDYYESGALHPDLILADLIKIFHPDLLPDHELVYYRQLE
ncbi:MAG: ABC transporter substrate-binding protein [Anaerolineae bacterium]|nr:ABC transporter substrate-binding protein [Anaerolineae bacterium]